MANHWLASATCDVPLPEVSPRPWWDALRSRAFLLLVPFGVLLDFLLINLILRGTYHARFVWGILSPVAGAPAWHPYVVASLFVSAVWVACLAIAGCYKSRPSPSLFDDLVRLVFGMLLGTIVALAAGFFYREFSYSRLLLAYGLGFSLLALALVHATERTVQRALLARGFGALNVLVVGCNSLGVTIGERLKRHPHLGYRLVGFVPGPGERVEGNPWIYEIKTADLRKASPPFGAILGRPESLPHAVERYRIDEVILALPGSTFADFFEIMGNCSGLRHLRFRIVPDLLELATAKLHVQLIDGIPTLEIHDVPLRKWYNRTLKRTMDILLSALALLVLSPLLALISLLVKLSSPGPVFYAQERLGRDGRIFPLYKFRSMRIDAEEKSGPVWAVSNDPRTTPIGAFLRRFSLDELPQFYNVLRGDMTLVGPRPERPYFVDQFRSYIPKYMDRHLVRSGLTGWAQINGQRGQEGSIEERTRYDIYYIENWSLLFDLRILIRTAIEVLVHPQ